VVECRALRRPRRSTVDASTATSQSFDTTASSETARPPSNARQTPQRLWRPLAYRCWENASGGGFCLSGFPPSSTTSASADRGNGLGDGDTRWDDVPPLSKNTYADMQDTTEYGAYGLGIVLASRLTGQPQQWSNRALLWVLCRRGLDWQPISFTFWTHPEMPPAVGKTKIPLATLY